MEKIIIDTNIWHYSYITTKEKIYEEIHKKAKFFIIKKLNDPFIKIILTAYQASEILELLRKILLFWIEILNNHYKKT